MQLILVNCSQGRRAIMFLFICTRGVVCWWRQSPISSQNDTIEFITMATQVNATDFGDIMVIIISCCASSTRGCLS